ncbi:small conductance mechanosensitive channel [Hoeflea marina]|uniref:Small conductance mechanosensitive channel n=1 Tax=Hoeflea marina TaxID=274592 RepID=A0A317PKD7_9HYPH|nr:mechanosensitive ion channel domain-containing protein [Hoeflea marina]PWW00336.1 small conductance mechanosensitive channel [Hoeflea marina]
MPRHSRPLVRTAALFLFTLILAAASPTAPVHAQSPQSPLQAATIDSSANPDAVIAPLLDVLKDEAARQKLIESLEKSTAVPADAAAANADTAAQTTVAGRLAGMTKNVIEETLAVGHKFARDLSGLATLFNGASEFDGGHVLSMLTPLLATVVVSMLLLMLCKRGLRSALARLSGRFQNHGFLAALALVGLYFLAEILALALAYFAGSAVAAALSSGTGVSIYQTLYLNAFLVTGAASILIRVLTGIAQGDYAVLRMAPSVRATLRRRAIVLTGLLIYGIAFVVPAANVLVSFSVGRGLRVLVYTLAAIFAVCMVRAISRQQQIAAELPAQEPTEEGDAAVDDALPEPVQSAFMQLWPLIAYGYVAVSYVIALSRPDLFVEFVGGATVRTALALIVGGLVLRGCGYLSTFTVRTPAFLPLDSQALSNRLTSFVPILLRVVWLLVSVAILAVVLDAWSIVDVGGWVEGDRGSAMIAGLVSSLIVVVSCIVIWAAASSWIDYRMATSAGTSLLDSRYRTLYSLLKNALTVALVVFGGMIALSELGIDIGPLLAGAGVLGLAIGFGAQKLVQDIISGVFIQLENAMNVGDVVGAGGITGVVERLTLRSVSLRDLSGVYHIIPFSSVDSVSNYMRTFSFHVEEVGIAYKENVADGKAAMQEAFDRLQQTEHKADILEPLEMHGVTGLGDSAVAIRARIKTAPGKQWGLGRAYTELVKQVMDERGIEIPFPHTTLFLGRDKAGKTDELPVKLLQEAGKSGKAASRRKRASTDDVLANDGNAIPESDD